MSKNSSRIFLIITQCFGLMALLPWFYLFAFSFMAFDAPGSEKQILPYLIVGGICLYPAVLLFCIIRSWILFNKQRFSSAAWTMAWIGIPSLLFMLWLGWINI